jgi:flagellar biosynthesis/type III secretory pathway protein FliH
MTAAAQRFEAIDFTHDTAMKGNPARDERMRQAYQQGLSEGAADANAEATSRLADAVQALADAIAEAGNEAAGRWTRLEAEAADCAVLLARTLSAGLVQPETIVAETMRTLIATLATAPRLDITVHPNIAPRVASVIEEARQPAELSRFIRLQSDEALAEADCRIAWAGGAIRRNAAELNREIDAIIARSFPAMPVSREATE